MLRTVFREGNPLPTRFNSSIAKDWLERFSIRPGGRIDRLPVIMCIKSHRAFRFRRDQLAENHWPAPADGEQMRFDPTRFEHLDQMRRILLDVRCVAGNVGDRQEFAQLADDAVLVVHPIVAHFLSNLCRHRRS